MISQVLFSFFSHFISKRNRQNVTPFEASGLILTMEQGEALSQRKENKLEANSVKFSSDRRLNSIGKTSHANLSRLTHREFAGKNTREQSIFMAYKKRNIFRLVFLFSENGITTLFKIFLEIEEYLFKASIVFGLRPNHSLLEFRLFQLDPQNQQSLDLGVQSTIPYPSTHRILRKGQGATDRGWNSFAKAQFREYADKLSYARYFRRIPVLKFSSKIQKPLVLLICLIPYVIILGFVLTLTSFKLSRCPIEGHGIKFDPRLILNTTDINQQVQSSSTRLLEYTNIHDHDLYSYKMNYSHDSNRASVMSDWGLQKQSSLQRNFDDPEIRDLPAPPFEYKNTRTRASILPRQFHFGSILYNRVLLNSSFEILRFANYASKIFVLWGFFNIWRGIRPGQSTRNEYTIQTRILTITQNRKNFQDVEGIEKFLPILRTLVQSLQKYRLFALSSTIRSFNAGLSKNYPGPYQPKLFPKGYLFIGPPGTGKTLLAQAVAGEAGVKLICLSASEIQKQIESGTRIGAIRLRNLFKQARKNTPSILFLDEIDSIGKVTTLTSSSRESAIFGIDQNSNSIGRTNLSSRSQIIKNNKLALFSGIGSNAENIIQATQQGGGLQSEYPGMKLGVSGQFQSSLSFSPTVRKYNNLKETSDYSSGESLGSAQFNTALSNQYESTSTSSGNRSCDITLLTEFLIQMDSFSSEDGFLVIGTTNFLPNLDAAFIRSGRFDRIIGLQFPGKQTRIGLLKLYGKKQGVDPSISWDFFGKKTKGLSSADLSKVMNESSLYLIEKYLRTRQGPNLAKLDTSPIYKKWIRAFFSNKQQKLLHTSESIEKGIEKISTREKFLS